MPELASATPWRTPACTRTCGRASFAARAGSAAAATARHMDTRAGHPSRRAIAILSVSKLVTEPHTEGSRTHDRVATVDERFGVDVHDRIAVAGVLYVERPGHLADSEPGLQIHVG